MFLTQSRVSAQIKQLTDIGKRVLNLSFDFEKTFEVFDREMAQLSDPESGDITVSCVNTCQYFFPRILGHFCRRYPHINVSFKVFNRQHIMERIAVHQDDFYIMDYIAEELDVRAVPFVDNPLVLICHSQHPLANKKNIALEELETETLLVRETGSGTRRETDMFFNTYDININSKIELGSSEAIKQGVMGELGIGVLSQYAVALELNLGILKMLDVQGFPLMRKWNIAYPSWSEITPAVRTFIDYLKNDGREIATQCLGDDQLKNALKRVNRQITAQA